MSRRFNETLNNIHDIKNNKEQTKNNVIAQNHYIKIAIIYHLTIKMTKNN